MAKTRISAIPNFNPAMTSTGMVTSNCTVENQQMALAVKRFSTDKFELPEHFFHTNMAGVMRTALEQNFPHHTQDPNIRGVKELYGTAKGKTMVLCGSGYSLKAVRDRIPPKGSEKHKDLVIVAMNGAMKHLKPEQVDFFAALDWMSPDDWHKGYDTTGIKAILGLTVPEHFRGAFKERYYYASNLFAVDEALCKEWVEKVGQLDNARCVTYSMMHLAWRMGCRKVIFLGHDFACVGDALSNWYNADTEFNFGYAQNQESQILQDMFNNATITTEIMIGNMETIATACKFCELDGMVCINASEAGIMALEDRCMTFEEALAFKPSVKIPPLKAKEPTRPVLDWVNFRQAEE